MTPAAKWRSTAVVALGGLAAALVGIVGWLLWPALTAGGADPEDARQVALGQAVYAKHCASCHGANLEGEKDWRTRKADGKLPAPPHDATGHTWHHSDAQLFGLTKHGLKPPLAPPGYASDMPAFAGVLRDDEIWAVLAYIKSKWPEHIRVRQSGRAQAAR